MIRIGICDDDKRAVEQLRNQLKAVCMHAYRLSCWNDASSMLGDMEEPDAPATDLLFLDIRLEETNGIELSQEIRRRCPGIRIIYFTAYSEYGQDVFDGHPSGFLLKPIQPERLKRTLDRVIWEIEKDSEIKLHIKNGAEVVTLLSRDILYVESKGRVLEFQIRDGTVHLCYGRLNDYQEKLPETFIRCHQSYLVNPRYISRFRGEKIILTDGTQILISRTRRLETRNAFYRYIDETM